MNKPIDELPGAAGSIPAADQERFWQACAEKDPSFDGRFVLGVRTTGIYCRPSCPARPPLRKNVSFYATPDQAEAAGLRPCKRCQPREGAMPDAIGDIVARAAALIEQTGRARLEELGAELHVSPFHLQRNFKRILGVSPLQYARSHRVNQVKAALRRDGRVTDAIYEAGFESSSRMYEQSNQVLGMTPGDYRRGGQGMTIQYALTGCALGRMLLAGTVRGVCAVYFGDDDAALEGALMREYPAAALQPGATGDVQTWARLVADYLDNQPVELRQLPLDVRGTAFQARVWQALRDIPAGQTRSYGEVAAAIGQPSASRAVANACGANNAAVIIPCHRVVREDGRAGGYRWGAERKAKILAREGAKIGAGV